MALAMGSLFVAGATIGLISLVLPHPGTANVGGLWSNVALAYAGGTAVLTVGPRMPRWFFHLALAVGGLLITRAVFLSGEAVSFYAAWYVWIGLYAFYFFSRVAALGHVAFVAVLFAVTLAHESASSPVARWLTTISTLVVAGVFIDTLVRRARAQAALAAQTAGSLATVADVAHRLSGLSDGRTARRQLCEASAEVTGADLVVLWEPSEDHSEMVASAHAGDAPAATVQHDTSSGVVRTFVAAERVATRDPEKAARLAPEYPGAAACTWQPVLRDGRVIAVLGFSWSQAPRADGPLDTVLELLSAETAATLQRIELLERLGAIARTDDLTGLPNRRAWNEDLARELARATRQGTPLCVAIVDLDHFKVFNDTHGHQAGDRLLKQAAAEWSGVLRATDLLARYGGEEFALALPAAGPGEAADVVERLRDATPGGESCSAGVVWWDGAETAGELVARADAALYEAKRAGRARAVFG